MIMGAVQNDLSKDLRRLEVIKKNRKLTGLTTHLCRLYPSALKCTFIHQP